MKKKSLIVATLVLAVVVCLSALVGCDGSARNVKYLSCDDYLHETWLNITMSKRLRKAAKWGGDMEAIKFKDGLPELFDMLIMEEGYVKTLHGDYVLIEKEGDGKLYTWGIFPMSAWIDGYNGEYDYVLTNMTCHVSQDDVEGWFFFPIFAMEHPLVYWEDAQNHAFNMTIDELDEFYTQRGFTTQVLDNILTVSTPIKRGFNGYECYESWEVTFNGDGTVSVGNFLEHVTIYD